MVQLICIDDTASLLARRRPFAIILHREASKTQKLLLFGKGDTAGEGGQGARRRARSDRMAIECWRGISVSSAVMSFEHEGLAFNLLDTPGHQKFHRGHLPHPDRGRSSIMVLDAAEGIEEQTRKLFEVCRLRDVPIITFVNKLDARPATRWTCWTRSSSRSRST